MPEHLTLGERTARGREARKDLPRGDLAELVLPDTRPDPVTVLEDQASARVPELVPIRYGRMLVSPFTFYRGAAAVMAADLGAGPSTGLEVQLCGDAHLTNFGLFASPERRLVFDLNDFDETHPGPWEWDVKRLVASLAVVGMTLGAGRGDRRAVVRGTVRRYRDAMAEFAEMPTLKVWYTRAEADELSALTGARLAKRQRKAVAGTLAKARANESLKAQRKLTRVTPAGRRITADPPLVVPVDDLAGGTAREELVTLVKGLVASYGRSLPADRRVLLEKYEFVDMARKVVGVGSVGTRCWIILLRGRDDDDPLFLQAKEAPPSVLAKPLAGRTRGAVPDNQGERVVAGQQVMQAVSDIFLGWDRVTGLDGRDRDFYLRQLRDQKGSLDVEQMRPEGLRLYGELCGWALARAHARSGDPVALSAYLGSGDAVPDALAEFAERYADLAVADHAALAEAGREGRIEVEEA